MWHLLTAKYSQKQTPKASIYSTDSDWQKSRTGAPLLWHSWDLLHTRKHTRYCYGMPIARAGTRRNFAAALQISVSGFWVVPNTACPNLPLNGNPFHQWLIYTHCYSPPAAASNFPNMEKVWMHEKGQYFYPCRDKFYCTVTPLSLPARKSPISWRGRSQLAAERRNTFTHVVAPGNLHESLQLLSKFPNKSLSQWFCIGRSKAQLGAWTWWGSGGASDCRLYSESWRY